MITLRLRHIFIFAFAILLTACQFEDDQECPDEINVGTSYINLSIAVSNGKANSTRAGEMPASGEDGNGREVGFERENAVTGVTLILYQAADGINTNTSDTDPKLEFVRYFPVSRVSGSSQGTTYDAGTGDASHPSQVEAVYTTGLQLIGKQNSLPISLSKTYHAIVVANLDLTTALREGESTLSTLKDYDLSTIVSGAYTDQAQLFGNFVMSSEEDYTINFETLAKNFDGSSRDASKVTGKDILYDLTETPIIIERMAARIDFWAKGAEYSTGYATSGYDYVPKRDNGVASEDHFVLTSITPFNLNNGNEYLLKHLSDGILKPETGLGATTPNYVLDPLTAEKTAESNTAFSYYNALGGTIANPLTVESLHGQVGTGLTGGFTIKETSGTTEIVSENVIICYPKENTLPVSSPLKKYATGLKIEGDYYTGNATTGGEHRVYYFYIRHQGEGTGAYESLSESELNITNSATDPMNFGIVRNNIYRVYVDHVKAKTVTEEPKVTLKIEVKKWDKFEHETIYM